MSIRRRIRPIFNHHLRGDDDCMTVLSTNAPLTPDQMKQLREAAKLLKAADDEH